MRVILSFFAACATAHAQGQWAGLAPMPAAQQECGVAALGGLVYVVGGFDADAQSTNRVWRYDPAPDAWQEVAPLPATQPLNHVACAPLGGKVYAIGGLRDDFSAVASCFVYDPATNAWSPIAPLALARGAAAAAVIDGKVYAAGGLPAARSRDFAVYDPALNQWTALPSMPTGRDHLVGAAVDGRFYAIAGRAAGLLRAENERYDPASGAWLARAPITTARAGCGAAVVHGRVFVFGGEGDRADPNGLFDETEAFDPVANAWSAWAPMSIPRHGVGGAALGGLLIAPGGATVEGFGASAANTAFTPCPGDANGDWRIDFPDLNVVLGSFGVSGVPGAVAGDLNADGAVDFADLNLVLSRFGAAC